MGASVCQLSPFVLATQYRPLALSVSLPLSPPRLTPTQGVTQSIQMCFALKPHYSAPVFCSTQLKEQALHENSERPAPYPPSFLSFTLSSSAAQHWPRRYCEQASLVTLIPWVLFAYRLSLVSFGTTQCCASSVAVTRPVSNFKDR